MGKKSEVAGKWMDGSLILIHACLSLGSMKKKEVAHCNHTTRAASLMASWTSAVIICRCYNRSALVNLSKATKSLKNQPLPVCLWEVKYLCQDKNMHLLANLDQREEFNQVPCFCLLFSCLCPIHPMALSGRLTYFNLTIHAHSHA